MLQHTQESRIKCPNCGSKAWYRKVNGLYFCKKCSINYTIEHNARIPEIQGEIL